MKLELCRSCGEPFEDDEMFDGICLQCSDFYESPECVPLDFEDKPRASLEELYDRIDKTGDCV